MGYRDEDSERAAERRAAEEEERGRLAMVARKDEEAIQAMKPHVGRSLWVGALVTVAACAGATLGSAGGLITGLIILLLTGSASACLALALLGFVGGALSPIIVWLRLRNR